MSQAAGREDVDITKPSVARAYDYVLGGKDNFAIDRAFADSVLAVDPDAVTSTKLNKQFGRRVVDHIARQGVAQFLDLGSGIPTSPPSVHDTARRVNPEARVVYVDHDPVVAAHNRALRAIGPGLTALHIGFDDPAALLSHPELTAQLDLDEPVAVLLLSVLQNTDDDAALAMIRQLRSRMAPGGYLAISHLSDRTAESTKEQTRRSAERYGYPPVRMRTDAELSALFEGFELVSPGIVDYRDWHPSQRERDERPALNTVFTGAVGILPG